MEQHATHQQYASIDPMAAAAAKLYDVYQHEHPEQTETALWRDVRNALRLNQRTIADAYNLLNDTKR